MAVKLRRVTGSPANTSNPLIANTNNRLGQQFFDSQIAPLMQAPVAPATPATAAPVDAPAAPDPYATAMGLYQSLLGDAQNVANKNYGDFAAGSLSNESTIASRLGATLGSRVGLADSAATQGNIDWGNVEAGNPFSQAALLQRSYHQQQARTTNGLASAGQLYSSSYGNQQGQDLFGVQQGQDSILKALQDQLGGQAAARAAAKRAADEQVRQAGLSGLGSLLGGG